MTAVAIILSVLVLAVAILIYPGEMSHVSSRLNRWLYDRAAASYDRKWRSTAYRNPAAQSQIAQFATMSCRRSGIAHALDLGCGSGRGIRLVAEALAPATQFTGIDFSSAMLDEFRNWLREQDGSLEGRVNIVESDLATWAERKNDTERYGLVIMLEVGEFVPKFAEVIRRVADVTAHGGGLILTRPAYLWWLFFPGRRQSRKALSDLLTSLGFEAPTFVDWRSRYELVFSRRR